MATDERAAKAAPARREEIPPTIERRETVRANDRVN